MSEYPMNEKVDANPLVTALVEKTAAGRLNWEATAAEGVFIASVGGDTTFRLCLEQKEGVNVSSGNPEQFEAPVLMLLNSKGQKQWEIQNWEVNVGLWPLYRLAQRVAYKIDEKMAGLVETVERL